MNILRANGKPYSAPKDVKIRKWRRGQLPKCSGAGFCEGMKGLLVDSANEPGGRIAAVGETDIAGRGSPEGIGFLASSRQSLLLFNCCPACGGKLNLPANQG